MKEAKMHAVLSILFGVVGLLLVINDQMVLGFIFVLWSNIARIESRLIYMENEGRQQ